MSNNINLIAFGTFGNPNGFKQTFFGENINKDLATGIKTFDLNTNAIRLFPKSKVYAIRKEYVNGFNTLAYAIYTFAKEQNSDRSGTFIGSSILFINKIADEYLSIGRLNEFHENLINRNIQNDIIAVNHSDKFSVSKPKDFDKTEFYLKNIENLNFIHFSNKNLVVYSELKPEKLSKLLNKAIDLLNVYDTIYFTDSEEVATYVHQKGIFKLVEKDGFEQEIQILNEERKQKLLSSIAEFEREKQELEDDKNNLIHQYKEQIAKNEKEHQENEQRIKESKSDLENINQFYSNFSKKIDDLTNQLKSSKKLEEVKQIYNENKRIFIDGINQQKKPNFINVISEPNIKSNLRSERQSAYNHESYSQHKRKREREEYYKIDIFKVISFVLFILWVGTISYFLFINEKKESDTIVETQQQRVPQQIVPETTSIYELDPKPNAVLNKNDYRLVAKRLKYNTKIDEVVKAIFDHNPTDIKGNYSTQIDRYIKQLIDLNKECFEEKNGTFFFVKDTLRHIPSYKRP